MHTAHGTRQTALVILTFLKQHLITLNSLNIIIRRDARMGHAGNIYLFQHSYISPTIRKNFLQINRIHNDCPPKVLQ